MAATAWLTDALVIVASGAAMAGLSHRLGLGPILGYLAAGVLIGPPGLGLVGESAVASVLGELGVVVLLFTIALELPLHRLRAIGARVFLVGLVQMVGTIAALIAVSMLAGLSAPTAFAVAAGFAFSSTAIVLRLLTAQGTLFSRHGRTAFAVLVVQDILVGPLLVVVVALEGGGNLVPVVAFSALKAILAVAFIFAFGRLLLPRLLRPVAGLNLPELFTAATVLIVLGAAAATHSAGLSLAFGAFLAGIVLAETGYRHQIAADMRAFRGLLLGLFFVTVGMGVGLDPLVERPLDIAVLTLGLLGLKGLILWLACLAFGLDARLGLRVALLLAQGGEFAFVLWGAAAAGDLFDKATMEILVLVVALTMAATPLLALAERRLGNASPRPVVEPSSSLPDADDGLALPEGHVVVAGCGLVGRQVLRHLKEGAVPAIGLDLDAKQVERARKRGYDAYYGDAGQPDVLAMVHVESARAVVVAFDDGRTVKNLVTLLRYLFPDLTIVARVHIEADAEELERAGASRVVPEVIDTGRHLARPVLEA